MLAQHGIKLRGIHWDTMIAQKILNENESSIALKNLSNKYGHLFGYEDDSYTYEQLFGKNTPFDEVDYNRGGGYYAAKDGQLTYLLFRWQESHFARLPRLDWIYRQIENPLIDVTIKMERTGFLIDLEYSEVFGKQLKDESASLISQIRELFGVDEEFNFDSPTQLAELLFEKLGLPDKAKGSVDAKALKFIQREHAGIPLLLEYRKLVKLLGTYVEALPAKVKKDGRLRSAFNQVGTVTGRFSSGDSSQPDAPNLQNLPEAGRKLVIAPGGYVIIGSDFSQIEPRVLAHISGDKELQKVYLLGLDLYQSMAAKVFGLTMEDCADGCKPEGWTKAKTPRAAMKQIILAIMYGLSAFSLAETLAMKVAEADQMIRDFYVAYPEVYRWIKSVHEFVKENEFVETLYGRKRRFPGHRDEAIIYDSKATEIKRILAVDELPMNVWEEDIQRKKDGLDPLLPYKLKREFQDVKSSVERVRRMAVNAVIQGTAADIMKLALIGLHEYAERKAQESGSEWAVNGTVHDEGLTQAPETITLAEVMEMEQIMTNVVKLDVPLKVDTEIFRRWGEGISKRAWFASVA
jgi:DNA polymerase I